MKQGRREVRKIAAAMLIGFGIIGLAIWTTGKEPASAASEMSSQTDLSAEDGGTVTRDGACCKAGNATPPVELVKQVPPGGLHSPYSDYAKMAKDDSDLVKQFRLPGCNECHGGTGGGGFCPALSQGIWFWGNTDDVLFRLITLGSVGLKKQGFTRYQYGMVHAPMPAMGATIPTSDQLWKIVAFIRSINPPGTNPPEKVIPGKYTPPEKKQIVVRGLPNASDTGLDRHALPTEDRSPSTVSIDLHQSASGRQFLNWWLRLRRMTDGVLAPTSFHIGN